MHVVVVPERAYPPRGRTWGIALQIYTLRSARNHGIGDFADLRAVCRLLGERGASYVGINPLHATFRGDPESASPYAAASRRWLNWLYIAVDDVPEHGASGHASVERAGSADLLTPLRATDHVDYAGVAAAKDEALRVCFAALAGSAQRGASFDAWCDAQGEPLRRFAVFEALVASFGREIEAWPAAFATPDSPDVALFAAAEESEVRYFDVPAMARRRTARGGQCRRGALGRAALSRSGRRRRPELRRRVGGRGRVRNAGLGRRAARPHQHAGPGLGAPGLSTRRARARWLRRASAALVQSNCHEAGALRIDHAFSLARLYWIPRGDHPRSGTYVTYPLDDLCGIVALASVRECCVVIGEDLGTVPEGFRERMEAVGILSYRILFFERRKDGTFIPPEEYPGRAWRRRTGTHDLPRWPVG